MALHARGLIVVDGKLGQRIWHAMPPAGLEGGRDLLLRHRASVLRLQALRAERIDPLKKLPRYLASGAVTPPSEARLFCPRMCDDEARCPCTGEPRIGVGLMLVLGDTNGNGRADCAGFRAEGDAALGVAQVVMGYSATAYPAMTGCRVALPNLF